MTTKWMNSESEDKAVVNRLRTKKGMDDESPMPCIRLTRLGLA